MVVFLDPASVIQNAHYNKLRGGGGTPNKVLEFLNFLTGLVLVLINRFLINKNNVLHCIIKVPTSNAMILRHVIHVNLKLPELAMMAEYMSMTTWEQLAFPPFSVLTTKTHGGDRNRW